MTARVHVYGLVGLLVGCARPRDSASELECVNYVLDVRPADDQPDAYYRTWIEVWFGEHEDGATVDVSGPSGAVAGVTDNSGGHIVFVPDQPLEPSSEYTVDIHYSCGDPVAKWWTSAVGTPTSAPLDGNAFALALDSGRIDSHLGPMTFNLLDGAIAVGVVGQAADELDVVGADVEWVQYQWEQAACRATWPLPAADFSANPYFEVGPTTVPLRFSGVVAPMYDAVITASVGPNGGYIAGATLTGLLDTRPLDTLFDFDGSGDPFYCNLAPQVGEECVECGPSNPGVSCLPLRIDDIPAETLDAPLVEIPDQATACQNPECADHPDCL